MIKKGPSGDPLQSPIKASNIIYLHQLGTVGTLILTESMNNGNIGNMNSHTSYRNIRSHTPYTPQIYIAAHKRKHSDYVRYRCLCGKTHYANSGQSNRTIETTCRKNSVTLIEVIANRAALPSRLIAGRRYWFHFIGGWIETEDGQMIHPDKWEWLHSRLASIARLA